MIGRCQACQRRHWPFHREPCKLIASKSTHNNPGSSSTSKPLGVEHAEHVEFVEHSKWQDTEAKDKEAKDKEAKLANDVLWLQGIFNS